MTTFYCDHGNSTLYAGGEYMATPTGGQIGQPQEGDGYASGTGTAPAVATCSVVFAAASGRSAGNLSILGVTVTPAYSDVADTQANNLATAVNASTGVVTFPSKGGNITNVYLKGVVWARGPAGGAPAGTCQIYSRIATDAFNGQAISVASWNGGPAPTNNDWNSAGVSGPWRYFVNTAALALVNASIGDAAMEYGAILATTMGSPGAGDVIKVRSKRAGADITVSPPSTSWTATVRAGGTAANRLMLEIDDGSIWTGDDGVFTLSFGTGTILENLNFPSASSWHWKGKARQNDSYSLRFFGGARSANFYYPSINLGNVPHVLEGFEVDHADASTGGLLRLGPATNNTGVSASALVKSGTVRVRTATGGLLGLWTAAFYRVRWQMEDVKFFYTNQTGANGSFLLFSYSGIAPNLNHSGIHIEMRRCSGVGLLSGTNTPWAAAWNMIRTDGGAGGLAVEMEDCDFPNANWEGMTKTNQAEKFAVGNFISLINTTADRSYILERPEGYREWRPGLGFPTLPDAVLPDGTPWSIRCCPLPAATDFNSVTPFESPPLSKLNTLADGARTATLQFCVDDDIRIGAGGTLTSADFGVRVTWTDAAGVLQSAATLAHGTGTPLAAGSTQWSTGNPPTYGAIGTFTAYQIAVPMASVKQNTNVTMQLLCTRSGATRSEFWFVSPEFSLA